MKSHTKNNSPFKEYDIRGIYGDALAGNVTLTPALAYDIGRAFITFLGGGKRIAVGRDARTHSNTLFKKLASGLTELGAEVLDLGQCSTPKAYFATASLQCDGGIMITASHNPKEYNGFKLFRAKAIPISAASGLREIAQICIARNFLPNAEKPGTVTEVDCSEAYRAHVQKIARITRPMRIAIDFANGMGTSEARALQGLMKIVPLFETPDGTFSNHEGNPQKPETLYALQKEIRKGGYDFGVGIDGDGDRAGFVDEKGDIIPMDLATALIAQDLLSTEKGATILYDLRSSKVVPETILAADGIPMICRVGHAYIKQQMRDNNAIFAGELSGHYYFRANYTTESTAMAILSIANILCKTGKPLSELVHPLRKYSASGEQDTKFTDPDKVTEVLQILRDTYGAQGRLREIDGVSVESDTWWFNVRSSNTEPLLRLNVESKKSKEEMIQKRDELLNLIRSKATL